jgi:hypothetical protein
VAVARLEVIGTVPGRSGTRRTASSGWTARPGGGFRAAGKRPVAAGGPVLAGFPGRQVPRADPEDNEFCPG